MSLVVEAKDLNKTFDREVLNGVNFSLSENRTLGLVGRNGAGKTTFIKIILGFLKPTKGVIRVFGKDPGKHMGKIGYLPEKTDYHLLFSGREYLNYLARVSGIDKVDERIKEVLTLVGMNGYGQLRMSRYSKGMLQRIGVAQALLHDPAFLILDEPLSGLDPAGQKELRDLIIELGELNKTILMCSHMLSEVENVCSDIAIIHQGKIVQQGRLSEILEFKNKYKLQLTGLSSPIFEKVSRSYTVNRLGEREVVFTEQHTGEKEEFLKALLEYGTRIDELAPLKMSLEDKFLTCTGGMSDE